MWQGITNIIKKTAFYLFLLFAVLPILYLVVLRYINPPLTPLMVQRLFEGYGYEKRWIDLEDIPKSMRYAAIVAEDGKFCSHHGFDFKALKQAASRALEGKAGGGGSTISMQLSKNLFLLPVRSYARKVLEAYYTFWLENILSKRRIMELYLNVIEFGQGVYGVESASHYYYKRSARRLTRNQSAQLVTILPKPLHWMPQTRQKRANIYMRRIANIGQHGACVR